MYREVSRIQRDFLYDPGFHGYDLAAWDKHAPYLDGLGSRHDLNYLLDEMLGELCLRPRLPRGRRHRREAESRKSGLLGADYAVENGRYRYREGLPRRELEPGPARPADPARRRRQGGRVPARRQRPGTARRRRTSTGSFEGTAGKQTVHQASARTPTARAAAR